MHGESLEASEARTLLVKLTGPYWFHYVSYRRDDEHMNFCSASGFCDLWSLVSATAQDSGDVKEWTQSGIFVFSILVFQSFRNHSHTS